MWLYSSFSSFIIDVPGSIQVPTMGFSTYHFIVVNQLLALELQLTFPSVAAFAG